MSQRRAIEQKLATLSEIHAIMGSIKTLAMLETRKLARFGSSQRLVVESIEEAARDLLASHPLAIPRDDLQVVLALGSERGFCGDYNRELVRALEQHPADRVIAVGHKLHSRLPQPVLALAGANVAEEVAATLVRLAAVLNELPAGVTLTVLLHDPEAQGPQIKQVLPPFSSVEPVDHGFEPRLNLPPDRLLAQLLEHYLLAELQALFYRALTAENERRMRHLDAAMRHLEAKVQHLTLRSNVLRQEEITEEIEVIMLNYQSLVPAEGS